MRITHCLEFQVGSKEEKLPYAAPNFPYLASRAELDSYREPFVPWHWHNAIELFYNNTKGTKLSLIPYRFQERRTT